MATGNLGYFTTTCPYRFYENDLAFRWIGETILEFATPYIVNQVKFLEHEGSAVGRIDHVLIHPNMESFAWCALEMQAVYFSGEKMIDEFRAIAESTGDEIPFPVGRRRPDFRSSGPKRLMPLLQMIVPTLRRSGKKMCVLVDRMLFNALGRMEPVQDVSNCDIAWFVVRYDENESGVQLQHDFVHLTTLEYAIEGLAQVNGLSLLDIEKRIRKELLQTHQVDFTLRKH